MKHSRRAGRALFRLVGALLALAAIGVAWDAWRIYHANRSVDAAGTTVWPAPRASDRVLLFAPHCDDETLAAGGYLRRAVEAGAGIRVVLMTNGDGFPLSASGEFARLKPRPADLVRLGLVRQKEALAALGSMGVPRSSVVFLGYPDAGLGPMWLRYWSAPGVYVSPHTRHSRSPYANSFTPHALYRGQNVQADVERILRQFQPTVVLCPHPSDNHSDHWATYTYVTAAMTALGLGPREGDPVNPRREGTTALQGLYLVHRGDWPVPQGLHPERDLAPPDGLARSHTSWARFPLTQVEVDAKGRAIGAYDSQVRVIGRFLKSFVRTNELFGMRGAGPMTEVPDGGIRVDGHSEDWNGIPVSVVDPEADSMPTEMGAAGDIGEIRVAADSRRLYFLVETRKKPSRRLAYDFSLHPLHDVSAGTQTYTLRPGWTPSEGVDSRANGRLWEVSVPRPGRGPVMVSIASRIPRYEVDRSGWRVLVSRAPDAPR